jgi:hypothetical protein
MLTPVMNGIQSEPASKAVYMSHLSSGVMVGVPPGSGLAALADTPVVLIHRPRQCGKTTLAQQVGRKRRFRYPKGRFRV